MVIGKTSLPNDNYTRIMGDRQGYLLVVADGVGGAKAGEIASTIAIKSIVDYALHSMSWLYGLKEYELYSNEMKESFERCRFHVRSASKILNQEGMTTTLTMAYIVWPMLYIVHVGDSRCFLFRSEDLKQITTDHTIAGLIEDNEFDIPPQYKNVLLDAVGMDPKSQNFEGIKTEFKMIELKKKDVLILCTDGLTNAVKEDEIIVTLKETSNAKALCHKLIKKAKKLDGKDNITVVTACFG